MSDEWVTLRVWLHRAEADAWLISLDGIGAGVWVPKSQIDVPEDAMGGLGGPVAVDIVKWIAIEKRLIAVVDPGQGVLL